MTRRSLHDWLLRASLALLGCGYGPGCAGTLRADDVGRPAAVRVAVVSDCCKAATSAALEAALRERLAKRAALEAVARSTPAAQTDHSAAIRAALARAHTFYVTMRMDLARRELQRAQRLCDLSLARGLSHSELARIHLYLVAISLAKHEERAVAEHSAAAVRFDPQLQPDADVFSPPVREAIARAQRTRQPLEVRVQSEPPGAAVFWDGERRGESPVALADQGRGEHYLRLEHLLHQPWQESVRLSTSCTLQIKLKPLPRAQLARVLRAHPEHFARAGLDVQSLVWISEEPGGLRVDRLSGDGLRTEHLAVGSSPAEIGRVAASTLPVAATATAVTTMTTAATAAATTAAATTMTTTTTTTTTTAARASDEKRPSRSRRTWWAWAAAGAVVLTLSIALPVGLTRDSGDSGGRGVRLRWP